MSAVAGAPTPAVVAVGARGAWSVVRTGLLGVLAAAAATMTVAALGRAGGISTDVGGVPIPVYWFGVLTVLFGLVGVVLAVALRRWARRPRRTFLVVTLALTALSLVPDLLADTGASTRALLMTTHLAAAALVVPTLARRLPTGRGGR
ncbi:DUF6069 family protein [Auraticoccus monumenti]|uniref:Uncharacterized protein n=1 Tax=Auraticoccus monumenti TaxID=675864 RepID=A0A1G6VNM5_9ACTN|nr:DUF6069 family protein [Auraticoccus monumenti]SDD55250.1 hypothetical protein SAMN04489747_1215 [Auraticoccus monumenti]